MKPTFVMKADERLLTTADVPSNERFDFWRDWVLAEFGKLDCATDCHQQFYGNIIGQEINDFTFNEVFVSKLQVERSPRNIRLTTEDDLKLAIPLASPAWVRQGNNAAICRKGDIVVFDSSSPYSLEFNGHVHNMIMQIPRRVLGGTSMPKNVFGSVISSSQGLGFLLSQQIQGLYSEMNNLDGESRVFMINNLVALLKRTLGVKPEDGASEQLAVDSALLSRAKRVIEIHLDKCELSPQFVAASLGISVRYLHKLFEPSGISMSRYVMAQRLERAERLLSDPHHNQFNITQIALMSGFADSAHFTRAFKRRYSYSPRDYRKQRLGLSLAI